MIALAVVAAAVAGLWFWLGRDTTEEPDYSTREARIKSVSAILDLCTLDVREEMAIKDSVNGKWIVARQTIEGRVRFNLDSLRLEQKGDTTFVYLPPERVDILENADPGSYEVLDAWDGRNNVFVRTMTAGEENVIKERWRRRARQRIYDRGYVRQARRDAAETLRRFFSRLPGETVVVEE